MAQADMLTLDTTYALQLRDDNGDWHWHDQTEYTTEADVHELGRRMYGGEVPYRVVTITRTVGEAVNPR
jgi:hypothetical protein